MSPSGMHWRCLITHAANIGADGLTPRALDRATVRYSTGEGDRYFGWGDAPGRSARELAVRLVDRFPDIAAAAEGKDWRYAGWLTAILGRAERGGPHALPVFYADYSLSFAPEDLPPLPEA